MNSINCNVLIDLLFTVNQMFTGILSKSNLNSIHLHGV